MKAVHKHFRNQVWDEVYFELFYTVPREIWNEVNAEIQSKLDDVFHAEIVDIRRSLE